MAEHRLRTFPATARVLHIEGGRVHDAPSPPRAERAPRSTAVRGLGVGPRGNGPAAWALEAATVGVAGRALLEDVELAGGAGEIVLVTGANGSGKTTLLRTIAGLLPALSGRVERKPGRVAYLPQEPGVLLHRQSVRREIEQTLRWTRAAGGAEPVLDLLGLGDLADSDPRDLSVGQRQRAALAAVLAGRPALAVLDEPTRGMDAAARRSLAAALLRLAEEGAAVVLATHDAPLARELPGRVLELRDGGVRPDTQVRTA